MTSVNIQKITPFLWFDNQAREAAEFYTSVFKNSKIIQVHPMVCTFELEGQRFMALNGGPRHQFTEAISFVVNCETQDEIDYYWEKLLSNGGREDMCGWLKDRYGLSWQIVPTVLGELMSGAEPEKSEKVMQALLKMVKLDIEALKQAYNG